jgi:AraC-like DNA-binding protein
MGGSEGVRPPHAPVRHHQSALSNGMLGELLRAFPHEARPWHHSHPEAEFNLVMRGSGSYVIDEDGVYELKPQTLIWLMPNTVHKLIRGPQLEVWSLVFRPDLLEPEWLVDLAAQPSRVISTHDLIGLDHLFGDIAQDSDEPRAFNPAIQYAVMRALRASHDRPSTSLKTIHPAVARALEIMRGDGLEASLSALAGAAGVAPAYLSRLMIEHTGRNFLDWRNRIRLDRFMELYRPGGNFLNLALEAGFGSYTRFHATFSDLVGCPPKEWARQVDAGEITQKRQTAGPAAGFGGKERRLLGARQRWAMLAPMASPAIHAVVGDGFLDRLVKSSPGHAEPHWLALEGLTDAPTPEDRDRLVQSLRPQDPDLAAQYGRFVATWDVRSFLESSGRHIEDSRLPPLEHGFTELLGGLLALVLTLNRRLPTTVSQVRLVQRQVQGALAARPAASPALVREAYVAMVCHFTVIRQSGLAGRAGQDPRAVAELVEMLGEWSARLFGGDVHDYELGPDGLAYVRAASLEMETVAGRPSRT